jgi:hypothetical protein
MKSTKKAASIIEAMVVLLVITTATVWVFKVYWESQKLSVSSSFKIQAIQIAREWIEAVKSIRDTNWLLYSADYENCWNTLDYNWFCVKALAPATSTDIQWTKSYIIYQNSDNRWALQTKPTGSYTSATYINNFRVGKNTKWLYEQKSITTQIKPIYTREIKISYLKNDGITLGNSNDPKMKITSLVHWEDNSGKKIHKVQLDWLITNWVK